MSEQHLRSEQNRHYKAYNEALRTCDDKAYKYHLGEYNRITNELNEWLRSCEG